MSQTGDKSQNQLDLLEKVGGGGRREGLFLAFAHAGEVFAGADVEGVASANDFHLGSHLSSHYIESCEFRDSLVLVFEMQSGRLGLCFAKENLILSIRCSSASDCQNALKILHRDALNLHFNPPEVQTRNT